MQGSFERVAEIAVGASVPADYLQTAEEHAAEGCYVLAMAHRLALVISFLAFSQIADCFTALINHILVQGIGHFSVLQRDLILLDNITAGHALHHCFPTGLPCSAELALDTQSFLLSASISSSLSAYVSPQT